MVCLADKLVCTGCSACVQVCTHQAIRMKADEEGFLFPCVDEDKCVECGLCTKHCPELYPIERQRNDTPKVYALINYADRMLSSSGGAFSAIARWILMQGGIVFGATMDKNFVVRHIGVDSEDDLEKLRGSKYVQSIMGDCYKLVRTELKKGRKVLFTGTGCQVAGLYAFLNGKRFEGQLLTLDLVCHGVPSQKTFHCYLEKLKKSDCPSGGNIVGFRFRKLDSWDYRPAVQLTESKWRILTLWRNAYMNAFFKGIIYRESCYRCRYCNMERVGTFSIADFWGIGKHGVPFEKNVAAGVSLVIDNANMMVDFRADLEAYCYIERRDMEEAITEQVNLKRPMERLPERDFAIKFLLNQNVSLKDFSRLCNLPYKPTLKWRMAEIAKSVIYSMGLYNVFKTLNYKLSK